MSACLGEGRCVLRRVSFSRRPFSLSKEADFSVRISEDRISPMAFLLLGRSLRWLPPTWPKSDLRGARALQANARKIFPVLGDCSSCGVPPPQCGSRSCRGSLSSQMINLVMSAFFCSPSFPPAYPPPKGPLDFRRREPVLTSLVQFFFVIDDCLCQLEKTLFFVHHPLHVIDK